MNTINNSTNPNVKIKMDAEGASMTNCLLRNIGLSSLPFNENNICAIAINTDAAEPWYKMLFNIQANTVFTKYSSRLMNPRSKNDSIHIAIGADRHVRDMMEKTLEHFGIPVGFNSKGVCSFDIRKSTLQQYLAIVIGASNQVKPVVHTYKRDIEKLTNGLITTI